MPVLPCLISKVPCPNAGNAGGVDWRQLAPDSLVLAAGFYQVATALLSSFAMTVPVTHVPGAYDPFTDNTINDVSRHKATRTRSA